MAAMVFNSPPQFRIGRVQTYHLLETMRAFALGELATSGAEPAARERAARALLALVERFGTPGSATAGGEIRGLCEAEMDNIRDALVWLRERDLALAVAAAGPTRRDDLWRASSDSPKRR